MKTTILLLAALGLSGCAGFANFVNALPPPPPPHHDHPIVIVHEPQDFHGGVTPTHAPAPVVRKPVPAPKPALCDPKDAKCKK